MSNYTAQQIEDAVKALEERNEEIETLERDDLGYDDAWSDYFEGWMDLPKHFVIDGKEVPVKAIQSRGGEGEGNACHVVFQLTAPDGTSQLFKKEGYYASYDGYYFDEGDCFECEAVPVTVIKYKKKGA